MVPVYYVPYIAQRKHQTCEAAYLQFQSEEAEHKLLFEPKSKSNFITSHTIFSLLYFYFFLVR